MESPTQQERILTAANQSLGSDGEHYERAGRRGAVAAATAGQQQEQRLASAKPPHVRPQVARTANYTVDGAGAGAGAGGVGDGGANGAVQGADVIPNPALSLFDQHRIEERSAADNGRSWPTAKALDSLKNGS